MKHAPSEVDPMSKKRAMKHLMLALPLALMAVGARPKAPESASVIPITGTHWAQPADFGTLRALGYRFAVVSVNRDIEDDWQAAIDSARQHNLQIIIGQWPSPYHRRPDGSWRIDLVGRDFLKFLAANPDHVLAVFGFNEPYWTDEVSATYPCGYYSAQDLRNFRTAVRDVWPQAKIYHDLDQPAEWAPGGAVWADSECIGDKYADQTGIADFAGIWSYPFDVAQGYTKQASLEALRREIDYVTNRMHATPVVLGQAFGAPVEGQYFPSAAELQDWNCALRQLDVRYISWYTWRQHIYDDFLAEHPDRWSATIEDCAEPPRRGGFSYLSCSPAAVDAPAPAAAAPSEGQP